MESSDRKECPVCKFGYVRLARHLVSAHGWRYRPESPNFPQPPEKPVSKENE